MTGDRMYDIDPYAVPQPKAPIPIYIWRGEIESWPSSQEDELQKQYWIDWNHVNKTPKIVTERAYTTEIYTGGDAEVRFTEIKNRGHNTYDLGTARKIWNDFFSRLSRDTIHNSKEDKSGADLRVLELAGRGTDLAFFANCFPSISWRYAARRHYAAVSQFQFRGATL